ncbi:MAG TPA: hypothetical protein VGL61_17655 [Kofleriaceae bacterium]|jgi:hypothetical protein
MRFAWLGLVVFACSPDIAKLPPLGGGGGGTGGTGSGSNPGSTTDANSDELQGFVCVLPDPRDFTACLAAGVGGISVALTGVGSAVTANDGTFTLPFPTGTNLTWTISGSNVVPSTMGFSTTGVVFALTVEGFNDLLNENGAICGDPTVCGTVLGNVLHAGSALEFTIVGAAPLGLYQTFYATPDDQQDWLNGSATSTLGTFLIAGLGSNVETLTMQPATGSAEIIATPITLGGLTFISAQL